MAGLAFPACLVGCLLLALWSPVCLGQADSCIQGSNCHLPACFCPTFAHPLGKDKIPQIVYFGFDDAVTAPVAKYYDQLFTAERKNPNNCPITMSLYVSDTYTDYGLVSKYYKAGNEAASHSVTHQNIKTDALLLEEGAEQKLNIEQRANVPADHVVGWRSPGLVTDGDGQPRILDQLKYTYDISLTYSRDRDFPFPFTLDYGYPYPCTIPPCPGKTSVHKGFWEVMVHVYYDVKTGIPCSYVDGCRPETYDDSLEYLWKNFLMTYENEKAPFGLNMHASWFTSEHNLKAMGRFIELLLEKDDVYIVSVEKMMKWMQTPKPLSELRNFEPWGCSQSNGRPSRAAVSSQMPPRAPLVMNRNDTTGYSQSHPSKINAQTSAPRHNPARESLGHGSANLPRWLQKYAESIHPQVIQPHPTVPSTEASASRVERPLDRNSFMKPSNTNTARHQEQDRCVQNENCRLPKCFCNVPSNVRPVEETTQIIFIAIDSPIDGRTYRALTQIFGPNRLNPNGCPVSGSIFVPVAGNYPPYAATLRRMGAKLGLRLANDSSSELSAKDMDEVRQSLSAHYGVRSSGVSAKLSNQVFETFQTRNDTSFNSFIVKESADASWPYTMDYGLTKSRCSSPTGCPHGRYPGVWDVPLSPFYMPGQTRACWFPDACPRLGNALNTYQTLKYNFDRHYFTNRLPFGISISENWLVNPNVQARINGLNLFLDYVLKKPNVMVVSVDKMLQWIAYTGEDMPHFAC